VTVFALVRRWWWLLAAAALAAGLVAWLLASHAARSNEASLKLLVGPVSADYPTLQGSRELGRTYAALAVSRPVVQAAARSAGVRLTAKQLAGAVSASSNDVTRIVDIRVRHPDAAAAAHVAVAVGTELVQLRQRVPAQQADAVASVMHDPALQPLTHAQRLAVRGAVRRAAWPSSAGDLEVVDGPLTHRVKPPVGLLVLLAAMGGAFVAGALAALKEGLARAVPSGPDTFEGFEVESFAPTEEAEPWLSEAREITGGMR
jgi:hypothetical protein